MVMFIPGIVTWEESSSIDGTEEPKGFPEQIIFNIGLEPIIPFSFKIFALDKSLCFLLESLTC